MDMGSLLHQFLQQLINGISLGSIYALIALGYTMIYGILKLINFAHGDIYMLGAYFGFVATTMFGFSFLPAILFAMACAAVAGIIIERIAYRPMRNAPRIAILITAIGVSFLLEYGMMLIATPQPRTFPAVFSADVYHLGPLVVNSQQVVILVSAIILMAVLTYIVQYTKIGKAMRAVSFDADAARLMGINIGIDLVFQFQVFHDSTSGFSFYYIMKVGRLLLDGSPIKLSAILIHILQKIGHT